MQKFIFPIITNLICDHWENQSVLHFYLLRRAKMPSSKFEANPNLHLRVRHVSFSLFPLASSYSNDYSHTYAIIDSLTNRLVFPNTATYRICKQIGMLGLRLSTKDALCCFCKCSINYIFVYNISNSHTIIHLESGIFLASYVVGKPQQHSYQTTASSQAELHSNSRFQLDSGYLARD